MLHNLYTLRVEVRALVRGNFPSQICACLRLRKRWGKWMNDFCDHGQVVFHPLPLSVCGSAHSDVSYISCAVIVCLLLKLYTHCGELLSKSPFVTCVSNEWKCYREEPRCCFDAPRGKQRQTKGRKDPWPSQGRPSDDPAETGNGKRDPWPFLSRGGGFSYTVTHNYAQWQQVYENI